MSTLNPLLYDLKVSIIVCKYTELVVLTMHVKILVICGSNLKKKKPMTLTLVFQTI